MADILNDALNVTIEIYAIALIFHDGHSQYDALLHNGLCSTNLLQLLLCLC